MAGVLKKHFPECKILFLGRTYTRDIINLSSHVDEFINLDDIERLKSKDRESALAAVKADIFLHVFPQQKIATLAKAAGITLRAGTTNRLYHWLTCNELIRLSRKNSPYHESQLNIKLLSFLNIDTTVPLEKVHEYYGLKPNLFLNDDHRALLDENKFNLILHPKSKGSAKEWGLENFQRLIDILPKEKYRIFISGTEQDRKLMEKFIDANPDVEDLTGQMSLREFISFIGHCDGLVAASTGPLHIAAALNRTAVGLYSAKRPIHPGRWQPIGRNAHALVNDKDCEKCLKKLDCDCITKISPERVAALLIK